jgi:hypothetical protein
MNWGSWLLWGLASTVVLTTMLSGFQSAGLTRLSLPFLLGTMLTADRDRAKAIGFALHLINGWVFSLVYVAAFQAWGKATWWGGAIIGLVHGGFVLTTTTRVIPGLHPRMASESQGPTVVRQLEPPGPLALNYGVTTPLALLVAHVVFGTILGAFYSVR